MIKIRIKKEGRHQKREKYKKQPISLSSYWGKQRQI